MKKLRNIHPGEILNEEFLKPLNISLKEISNATGISLIQISDIVKGIKPLDAPVSLRLAQYFGNSPKFWLGLQDDYDIEEEMKRHQKELINIQRFDKSAA